MAIANSSYLTDVTEFEDEFSDGRYIRELATRDITVDAESALSGIRLDFVHRAMNWGARHLENMVRVTYSLTSSGKITDTVSSTSPDEIIKIWNSRLALFALEAMRPHGQSRENLKNVIDEITGVLALDSQIVLSLVRSDIVTPRVGNGRVFRGALADLADQFGNVIPTDERDAKFTL